MNQAQSGKDWRSLEKRAGAVAEPASQKRPANSKGEIVIRIALNCVRKVLLAAEFTDWERAAIPMLKCGGIWHARLRLPPGRYPYRLIVEGREGPRADVPLLFPFGILDGIIEVGTPLTKTC